MRGPKPKPTARRQLEGNPGRRPYNANEPIHDAPTETFDEAPLELRDHPHAAREWCRLSPLLRKARQITDADRAALMAVCLEWSRYLEATAQVKKIGLVITTKTGYPMANPYLPIATKALAACNKLWPELGLTPSSRTRVKTEDVPPSDAWSEFDRPVQEDLH